MKTWAKHEVVGNIERALYYLEQSQPQHLLDRKRVNALSLILEQALVVAYGDDVDIDRIQTALMNSVDKMVKETSHANTTTH